MNESKCEVQYYLLKIHPTKGKDGHSDTVLDNLNTGEGGRFSVNQLLQQGWCVTEVRQLSADTTNGYCYVLFTLMKSQS